MDATKEAIYNGYINFKWAFLSITVRIRQVLTADLDLWGFLEEPQVVYMSDMYENSQKKGKFWRHMLSSRDLFIIWSGEKNRRYQVYIEVGHNKCMFIRKIRHPCLCSCYQNLVITIVTYIYDDFYAEISIKKCSICWILHITPLRMQKIHWIYLRRSHSLFTTWIS